MAAKNKKSMAYSTAKTKSKTICFSPKSDFPLGTSAKRIENLILP